jgi:cobalt-precorrin 5A hydrolase
MVGREAMIVAGIGCRMGCPEAEIIDLVRQAEQRTGAVAERLATPAFKRREPGLLAAAGALGLELAIIDEAALEAVQHRCPTRSSTANAATGFASVAEACALAASGPDGRLILPRIASAGATCAFATTLPAEEP